MTGRIILIGMPAGGKTTIGAALSRALSVPLYDADALTEQNRELLRRSGTVFWLDRTVDNIMSTDYAAGRPLLAGGEAALRALYAVRCPLYAACAHYRVPDGTVDQMKDFILRLWRDTP